MNRVLALNRSKKMFLFSLLCIFAYMVFLNCLTPKCVDDYAYMISLSSIERINGISDIIESLFIHAFTMNGRLVSHFFVYLFDWLPKYIFNIVNSAMFVLLILLVNRISKNSKDEICVLNIWIIFFAVWLFELDFGQVNLWLTGSCNYLWSLVISILFVFPFYELYSKNKAVEVHIRQIVFVVFSFFAGAYNEVASFAAIFISTVFYLMCILIHKRRVEFFYWISIIAAFFGYASMLFSPAESAKSKSAFSIETMWSGFMEALKIYFKYWPLLIFFLVFIFLALYNRKYDHVQLAVVFFFGSLAANFILIAASGYPGRCAAASLVFLIVADSLLLNSAMETRTTNKLKFASIIIMLPFMTYSCIFGIYDVYNTGRLMRNNIDIIIETKENGNEEVSLQYVIPNTKYSAIYNLKYLDCERSDIWPNENMATYFGIKTVNGIW